MLRIYEDTLAMVREVRVYRELIERSDRDHAKQLRRASKSVVLGLAEGAYSRKGNRKVRYHEALGSARETLACLELAVADGTVDSLDEGVLDRLDKIIRTLVKLTR
jgi:four helix bundle protein